MYGLGNGYTNSYIPVRVKVGVRVTSGAVTSGQTGRRRADAVRNQAAILAATRGTLSINPDATMAQIAHAAGVGRVTLYGHFSNRAELIDAALADVLHRGNGVLEQLDLDGIRVRRWGGSSYRAGNSWMSPAVSWPLRSGNCPRVASVTFTGTSKDESSDC